MYQQKYWLTRLIAMPAVIPRSSYFLGFITKKYQMTEPDIVAERDALSQRYEKMPSPALNPVKQAPITKPAIPQ
jgi:hypothetical protein